VWNSLFGYPARSHHPDLHRGLDGLPGSDTPQATLPERVAS